MRQYFLRMWHIILFGLIWIGIPWLISIRCSDYEWMALTYVTWIPAVLTIRYLEAKL